MQYKSTVLYHIVRVPCLFAALKWLKENNADYKDVQIENEKEFIEKCKLQDPELHDQLFTYEDKPVTELIEQQKLSDSETDSNGDDQTTKDEQDEIVMRDENFQDTMVTENDGPLDIVDTDQQTEEKEKEEAEKLKHMSSNVMTSPPSTVYYGH